MNFVEIINRIKNLKNIKKDYEVALLLEISSSAFAERKRRNSIPYFEIIRYCGKEGLPIDYVFTGETIIDSPENMVAEKPKKYRVSVELTEEERIIIERLRHSPKNLQPIIYECINHLFDVYFKKFIGPKPERRKSEINLLMNIIESMSYDKKIRKKK